MYHVKSHWSIFSYEAQTSYFNVLKHSKMKQQQCLTQCSGTPNVCWQLGLIMEQGLAHAALLGLCCVLDVSALLTVGGLSADISRHWQAQPWHWQRLCAVEAPWGSSVVIQLEGPGGLAPDVGTKVLQRCSQSKWQTPCYYAGIHLWGPVRHVSVILRGNRGETEVKVVKCSRSRGRELYSSWY